MLWMRAWFETRWRLALVAGYPLVILGFIRVAPLTSAMANLALFYVFLICVLGAMNLGGAGIHTRSIFHTVRGFHESVAFTVTLPVSRLRLLLVRAAVGLMETAAALALVAGASWVLFPAQRPSWTAAHLLHYVPELFAFCAANYFVAVFFATFLEDLAKIYATFTALLVLWVAIIVLRVPRSVDMFRLMNDSLLTAHEFHWRRIVMSSTVSLVSILAAARIVQTREY
jgi:hypothetical protein